MKRQRVDPPALPVVVVARLRPYEPTGGSLPFRPLFLQPGMIGVEQAIQVAAATPEHVERGAPVQRVEDCTDRRERVSVDPAELHIRDRRLAHAGPISQVALTPTSPMAKHPDDPAGATIVHQVMLPESALPAAYPPIARRSCDGRGSRRRAPRTSRAPRISRHSDLAHAAAPDLADVARIPMTVGLRPVTRQLDVRLQPQPG